MRIPVYLAIAQWALLFALGMLVIVMYRQLGRAFHRPRSTGELGPPVGSKAADLEYTRLRDGTLQYAIPGDGQAMLLAFADPTCPSCERLVEALGEAQDAGELASVRVLLLVSDPPSYLEISDAFRKTHLELGQIVAQATVEAYKASATPLLVAIDRTGTVRSAGPAVQRAEVKAFSQACLDPRAEVTPLDVVSGARNGNSNVPSDRIRSPDQI